MTTHCISRFGVQKVAMSMMIAAIAAAGSSAVTRTAAADDTAIADQISATDPTGSTATVVQDGAITQSVPVADPNSIDPGSLVRVNRFVNDSDGVTYRQVGFRWTSLGVPHSRLTLTRLASYDVDPDPVVDVAAVPTVSYYSTYYPAAYYSHYHYPYAYGGYSYHSHYASYLHGGPHSHAGFAIAGGPHLGGPHFGGAHFGAPHHH